jgi:hypothetical protein
MEDIRVENNLQTHVRRDFSISGVKAGRDDGPLARIEFPSSASDFAYHMNELAKLSHIRLRRPLNEDPLVLGWTKNVIHQLILWKNDVISVKLYRPGPVSGVSIISRHISFGNSGKKKNTVTWDKKKRLLAARLQVMYPDHLIAQVFECTEQDIAKLWQNSEMKGEFGFLMRQSHSSHLVRTENE